MSADTSPATRDVPAEVHGSPTLLLQLLPVALVAFVMVDAYGPEPARS